MADSLTRDEIRRLLGRPMFERAGIVGSGDQTKKPVQVTRATTKKNLGSGPLVNPDVYPKPRGD